MANQEKQAWIQLIIVVVTLAAYVAMISFVRFDSVSLSVFALAGFLGFRPKRRQGEVIYDERDHQIERQALLSSMCVFYIAVIVFSIVAGIAGRSDTSVPVWMVIQLFWALSLVVWAIKALIIITLYRRSVHA